MAKHMRQSLRSMVETIVREEESKANFGIEEEISKRLSLLFVIYLSIPQLAT